MIYNINEGGGYGWQFDDWIYNAVLNEPLYKSFAEDQIQIENLSYIVSSIECDFVQFLLKTNHVYEFKKGNRQNRGLRKNPIRQKEFNQIEELILKTVNSRIKDKKSLNWMSVLRDLKNNVATGQSIHLKDSPSRDELMRPCISLFIDGLDEPIHRMQISTFKKKLSQFRKITITRVTGE